MSQRAPRRATQADFWAIPEHERFHELIDGVLIEKASPSGEHGDAQAGIISAVRPPYQRAVGRGGPGGWWILTEVEVLLLDEQIVRPDVVGWRRDRCPERPTGFPIKQRPDWICEVISPLRARDDRVTKLRLYHRAGVPYYWVVDSRDSTIEIMRWSEPGYVTLQTAERGETIRAEPFDAIEIVVGTLFGDDPPA
jgi:Uma2 family endonuclease